MGQKDVWWPITEKAWGDRVAVVTVSYNTAPLTSLLLWSLYRVLVEPPTEILVVDNGSRDGSAQLLTDLDRAGLCTLLENKQNTHHGPALNRAMSWLATRESRPDWVWVLDSDVVIARPDAMTAGLSAASRSGAALVGEPMWDQWNAVDRLELFSLLLDPAQVWVAGIGPFDGSGDPAWPVIESARRANLVTEPFSFASDGYVIHRGRGTLAAVAERAEADNPLYEWAVDHREPHFAGVEGAKQKYGDLASLFAIEVPSLTSEALLAACRPSTT